MNRFPAQGIPARSVMGQTPDLLVIGDLPEILKSYRTHLSPHIFKGVVLHGKRK